MTMAAAFHPIEKTPPTLTGVKSMQVSHSQALNLLHKAPSSSGSIIRRPTPMRIVDQPVDKSESSAGQMPNQPVIPVSFASTTQVRMDIAVPSPVGQGVPQVSPVWVPLLQITSVASMANVAASMTSQQLMTSVTTQPQQQTQQCQKCGKKYHLTVHCHKKITCRKCKGKDHSAKFCSTPSQEELKCTFCGKAKHSVEMCKAKKKAEKRLEKEMKAKRTSMVTSATTSTMSSRTPPVPQAQPSESHQQTPVTHETIPQVPLQAAPLVTSAGCSLKLKLLNRSEGDVTTAIARMGDTVSDDSLKEEIMKCFSNAPTMIQAIRVLRGKRQEAKEAMAK